MDHIAGCDFDAATLARLCGLCRSLADLSCHDPAFPRSPNGVTLFRTTREFACLDDVSGEFPLNCLYFSTNLCFVLVHRFIAAWMDHCYDFPGSCGRPNCERDRLDCTPRCIRYARQVFVDGEFRSNLGREYALMMNLARKLRSTVYHTFGPGYTRLQQTDQMFQQFGVSMPVLYYDAVPKPAPPVGPDCRLAPTLSPVGVPSEVSSNPSIETDEMDTTSCSGGQCNLGLAVELRAPRPDPVGATEAAGPHVEKSLLDEFNGVLAGYGCGDLSLATAVSDMGSQLEGAELDLMFHCGVAPVDSLNCHELLRSAL